MNIVPVTTEGRDNYICIINVSQNYRSLSVTPLGTPTAIEAFKLLNWVIFFSQPYSTSAPYELNLQIIPQLLQYNDF